MLVDLKSTVIDEVSRVVIGREKETTLLLTCLLARGHVLLEGVPGTSKTLLAKSFAKCLGLKFRRVQFTPDMLPLDIVGGFIFNMKTREFEFKEGPVFTNLLLADEINRAAPKVQSALLESMQELQVTVEGQTSKLPFPFLVIATQNPLDFEGVYPLPESEKDRFMARINFGYPDLLVESEILKRNLRELDINEVKTVVSLSELEEMFRVVDSVKVTGEIMDYLSSIAKETRTDSRINLGASPRAMVQLVHCAQASAALDGRSYVTPDDIKKLAGNVLAHRMRLDPSGWRNGRASFCGHRSASTGFSEASPVKLTKRGADYLKACLVTATICSLLNVRMLVALSLAMMIAALISQVILVTASSKNISVELEKPHLSVFKGDSVIERVRIHSKRRRFVSLRIVSLKGPEGVGSTSTDITQDAIDFSFEPHYAGRFTGLSAVFELNDPLQLFSKKMEISRPDLTIDSLPRSLVADIRVARPMSITLGERTGRTHGAGQEFYALDDYKTSSEKRDIMWKAVARMPDDKLIVRIRESNIPKTLSVGLVRTVPRKADEEGLRWMDLACEGAGTLGQIILLIGCDVELIYKGAEKAESAYASNLHELSSAIMEMSSSGGPAEEEEILSIVSDSDICITGMKELEDELFARLLFRKPSLLISESEVAPIAVGNLSIVFTGTEDVNRLVNSVVGK